MKTRTFSLAGLVALTVFLTGLAAPTEASAEVLFQYAVGAKGGMNLNMLSGPPEEPYDLPVPGFVGVSGGGGLALEALALDIVGLELDLLYVKTSGTGSTTFNGTVDVEQTLETTELQIPVLLKLQIPVGLVKPYLGLGITYVSQLDSTYTIDDSKFVTPIDTADNPTESYTMLTASLGMAIDLPSVKIPIEVRGNYRAPSDKQEDRLQFTNNLSELNVNPTWEGQVWLLVGVQYSGGI